MHDGRCQQLMGLRWKIKFFACISRTRGARRLAPGIATFASRLGAGLCICRTRSGCLRAGGRSSAAPLLRNYGPRFWGSPDAKLGRGTPRYPSTSHAVLWLYSAETAWRFTALPEQKCDSPTESCQAVSLLSNAAQVLPSKTRADLRFSRPRV
jgi:hypothetical protein